MGYGVSNDAEIVEGGILIFNTEATLVKQIKLDFVPVHFVTGLSN